jgi:hypothetical protein
MQDPVEVEAAAQEGVDMGDEERKEPKSAVKTQNIPKHLKMYGKIQRSTCLTNKQGLFKSLSNFYSSKGMDPFAVLPVTYVI